MRIVSQDGMVDVPYENVLIEIVRNSEIIVFNRQSDLVVDRGIIIAEYTSKAKALKAMEMVRNAYELHTAFKILGSRNGLMTSLNEVFGSMEESAKRISPIFQFPKDDEVEV